MSRTRRRLARSYTSYTKRYQHIFRPAEIKVGWRYWLLADDSDRWIAEHIHHEIFRNGSCRRQRKNGIRLTKRLDHSRDRTDHKRQVRKELDYYCECGTGDLQEEILDVHHDPI